MGFDGNCDIEIKDIDKPYKVIGIIANLRPMKRHVTFLHAAKKVVNKRNDIDFVIVGDGHLRGDLTALSCELGIQDHTHFVGSRDDILSFLSIFDIGGSMVPFSQLRFKNSPK